MLNVRITFKKIERKSYLDPAKYGANILMLFHLTCHFRLDQIHFYQEAITEPLIFFPPALVKELQSFFYLLCHVWPILTVFLGSKNPHENFIELCKFLFGGSLRAFQWCIAQSYAMLILVQWRPTQTANVCSRFSIKKIVLWTVNSRSSLPSRQSAVRIKRFTHLAKCLLFKGILSCKSLNNNEISLQKATLTAICSNNNWIESHGFISWVLGRKIKLGRFMYASLHYATLSQPLRALVSVKFFCAFPFVIYFLVLKHLLRTWYSLRTSLEEKLLV